MGNFLDNTGSQGGQLGGALGGLFGPAGGVVGSLLGGALDPVGSTGGVEARLLQLWGTADQVTIRSRLCLAGVPSCQTVSLLMPASAYGLTVSQAFGAGGCSTFDPRCGQLVSPGVGVAVAKGFAGFVPGMNPGGVFATPGVAGASFAGAAAPAIGKVLKFLLAFAEAAFLVNVFGGTNTGTGPVNPDPVQNRLNFVESTHGVKTVSVNGQKFPRSLVRLWKDVRCSRLSHEVNLTRRLNPAEGRPVGTVMARDFDAKMKFLRKEQRDAGCIRRARSPRFGQRCCPTPQRRIALRCCG